LVVVPRTYLLAAAPGAEAAPTAAEAAASAAAGAGAGAAGAGVAAGAAGAGAGAGASDLPQAARANMAATDAIKSDFFMLILG
jgi:hypothetical protein